MTSKRIIKIKYIGSEIQKVMQELVKLDSSGLSLNQINRVIRCYITNKLYYLLSNTDVNITKLRLIDKQIWSINNKFLNGKIHKSVLYIHQLKI
jgi:hypothetical protein